MKFTKVAFPGPPNIYKDCNSPEKTPLKSFSKHSGQYPPKKNLVTTYNAPQNLHEMIPNGVKEDLPMVQLITMGLTFLGFLILTKSIIKKAGEKVVLAAGSSPHVK
jgi:hypothetical protein